MTEQLAAGGENMPGAASRPTRLDPHKFRRERDGRVKLRLNLTPDEADMIEVAAGGTPLMVYIHRVLNERAKFHVKKNLTGIGEPVTD